MLRRKENYVVDLYLIPVVNMFSLSLSLLNIFLIPAVYIRVSRAGSYTFGAGLTLHCGALDPALNMEPCPLYPKPSPTRDGTFHDGRGPVCRDEGEAGPQTSAPHSPYNKHHQADVTKKKRRRRTHYTPHSWAWNTFQHLRAAGRKITPEYAAEMLAQYDALTEEERSDLNRLAEEACNRHAETGVAFPREEKVLQRVCTARSSRELGHIWRKSRSQRIGRHGWRHKQR